MLCFVNVQSDLVGGSVCVNDQAKIKIIWHKGIWIVRLQSFWIDFNTSEEGDELYNRRSVQYTEPGTIGINT